MSDASPPDHGEPEISNDFEEERSNEDNEIAEDFINQKEEEDDGVFSDSEEEELSPDHPLYKRLQEDLKTQLTTALDAVELETRDKTALQTKLSADREQVGVELYSIQQQLAKLQTHLSDINEQRTKNEQERVKQEETLKSSKDVLDQNSADLDKRVKNYENQRDELDKLNEVVLRLEEHNQATLDQVAVTRRQAYKSEQSATNTETVKKDQDLYIDRLTQQLQSLTSQLDGFEAQIIAQGAETKTARDALLQASLEMEKITFERNHLVQERDSALLSVERRSATLKEIQDASNKQKEEIRAIQNESDGLKAQIADQHDLHERNASISSKIKDQLSHLDSRLAEIANQKAKLQSTLNDLYKLIAEKENSVSKLIIEENAAKSEFNLSLKGSNEVSNEIHEIEDKILKHDANQSDLKRDTVAAQAMVEKVRTQIEAKERELSDLQNEAMRLKIDRLNITGHCAKFDRGLSEIVEELKEKDRLISQYEMQIRRNNVLIEKKQGEVDTLNRKYEELTSAQNGEDYGPLERKIRQAEAKIKASEDAASESQGIWLKKQTELVALTKDNDETEDKNNTQMAYIAVLSRKRDRTRNLMQSLEKEINQLNIKIRLHQREMSRLGAQLSQFVGTGNTLVEGNVNFEAEILETLRKKEEESAQLEREIEEIASQREELADQLMESEKTIMLFEKKMQLAKEMKEALDPSYGAAELAGMKKEVARMELRLKQIKKQQQMIVQEMEYALKRRETIATRGAVQKRMNKDRTRVEVAKVIGNLRKEVKKVNLETERIGESMKVDTDAEVELKAELEQLSRIAQETNIRGAEVDQKYKSEEKEKISNQSRLEKLQAKGRLFQYSGGKTIVKSAEAFKTSFDSLKSQDEKLKELSDIISHEFPHLSDDIEMIKNRVFSN